MPMTGVPSWFLVNLAPPDPPLGRSLLFFRAVPSRHASPLGERRVQDPQPKQNVSAGAPVTEDTGEPELRSVQVVARWNEWVRVRDPRDGSEEWVDLGRTPFRAQ